MQEKIWQLFWSKKKQTQSNYFKEYHYDLKNIIDAYKDDKKSVIEVGCGCGLTSFLLSENFDKTLLDINSEAIGIAKSYFNEQDKSASFLTADMFDMDIKDKSYDIVFNSGVIEHFNEAERIEALNAYKRILKDDGIIIIAIPNHYNALYKLGYIILNIIGKWPYPEEFAIYDLQKELDKTGLRLLNRTVVAKTILFDFLNFAPKIKELVLKFNELIKSPGYLTVLAIEKAI